VGEVAGQPGEVKRPLRPLRSLRQWKKVHCASALLRHWRLPRRARARLRAPLPTECSLFGSAREARLSRRRRRRRRRPGCKERGVWSGSTGPVRLPLAHARAPTPLSPPVRHHCSTTKQTHDTKTTTTLYVYKRHSLSCLRSQLQPAPASFCQLLPASASFSQPLPGTANFCQLLPASIRISRRLGPASATPPLSLSSSLLAQKERQTRFVHRFSDKRQSQSHLCLLWIGLNPSVFASERTKKGLQFVQSLQIERTQRTKALEKRDS